MWTEATADEKQTKQAGHLNNGKNDGISATQQHNITFNLTPADPAAETPPPTRIAASLFVEAVVPPRVEPLTARPRRRYTVPIAVTALVVGAGIAGGYLHASSQPPTRTLPPPPRVEAVAPSKPKDLVVDVIGAVHRPGVYHLKPAALAVDALKAAGGPTSDANLNSVNLAVPVVDATQLLIPSRQMDSDDNTVALDAAGPATPASSADLPKDKFAVYVTGAVRHPGVYYLKRGMRNIRALLAAGGATPEGEITAINQAAIIRDGDQIWVPTHREYVDGGAWSASNSTGAVDTDGDTAPLRGGKERPVVDIEGAVRHPGVYFMDRGMRKLDAIKVAGGATEDANLNAVNLARFVEDGIQIFVPTRKHPLHTTMASARRP